MEARIRKFGYLHCLQQNQCIRMCNRPSKGIHAGTARRHIKRNSASSKMRSWNY
ncbi:hypothetical protein DPMN_062954 [Dreissena polymorpha]|uniref:Uncharacterized protein n=1 Tax=Dreissena polymorpha TaxID=45954 RepID=A0A9D4CAI9_DREPO|nr:hypothetical protein DPMN_062954 [Dreissena polymorpha]